MNRIQEIFVMMFLALLAAMGLSAPRTAGQSPSKPTGHNEAANGWPKQAVRGAHGMVVTDEELGSQAGIENLKRGGNAVDAAGVAALFFSGGGTAAGHIRGGGFLLLRPAPRQ